MIRRSPRSTRTDTLFPLHDALPIWCEGLGQSHTWTWRLLRSCRWLTGRAFRARPHDTVSTGPLMMRSISVLGATGSIGASTRSEEQTSELQSLMRISYAVFCLKKKKKHKTSDKNTARKT